MGTPQVDTMQVHYAGGHYASGHYVVRHYPGEHSVGRPYTGTVDTMQVDTTQVSTMQENLCLHQSSTLLEPVLKPIINPFGTQCLNQSFREFLITFIYLSAQVNTVINNQQPTAGPEERGSEILESELPLLGLRTEKGDKLN